MSALYATEAQLCAEFIDAIGADWTAYAETYGWDILLVRKADGFQIGIQAKLSLNAKVLTQAVETYAWSEMPAPDCRALLVPKGYTRDLEPITAYIGLTIIRLMPREERSRYHAFRPDLPTIERWFRDEWHEWAPSQRCPLPEYVPDVPAGASAPLQLTNWKISALKLAALLERRGFLLRSDFKHLRIDHRRWTAPGTGWLRQRQDEQWGTTAPRYIPGPHLPDFKAQHPRVYAEIVADIAKWGPADIEAPAS
ncbi:hypothetical protein [Ancylobacter defluvii]|uniref:Uncharacterized protein n=1 Tax=Ancylobacter defluvii TaxID=1282440 RepID=A0A9W6NCK6_9HYPH|nr:hypothetical protein [Ancylobacter defluvii]MBS7588267.1 hypothetical protein [Ancylobacter defluvii]GLK86664.1 hypothetical protein GCM10017653_47340 [Ancylobacter defluvii]